MKLYIKYSPDWPYLPEYVEDNVGALARKVGTTANCISSCISKDYKQYAKVEVEEDEEEKTHI